LSEKEGGAMINICEEENGLYIKQDTEYSDIILNYIKEHEEYSVSPHRVVDQYTGKNTDLTSITYTDGSYWWRTEDIYHIEKYNVKLRQDFVDYVLKNTTSQN
jgi:hypothetical protein